MWGVRVVPALTPLALKPVPLAVTLETVTLEFPVFVSVALKEPLPPTFTFPKLRLAGFAPSRKVAATPVPLSGIVRGEPGALLTKEIEPVTLPAVVGAKAALNVVLPPAASVSGRDKPLMLNPVPEALAAGTDTHAAPEQANAKVGCPLLPTRTFPKLTLAGLA